MSYKSYFRIAIVALFLSANIGFAMSETGDTLRIPLTTGKQGDPERLPTTAKKKYLTINFEILNRLPRALIALKGKIEPGEKILGRVNMNVSWSENPDTQRLNFIKEVVDFLLAEGATPILFAHNGRKEEGRDNRESLRDTAQYLNEKIFPGKVKFHEGSVKEESLTVNISKVDIIEGKVNIIENVRFADSVYKDKTGKSWEAFARSIIALSDGKLIIDAFGDVASNGPDIEIVPLLAEEVYLGPEMVKECHDLEKDMKEGYDAAILGGLKKDKQEFSKNIFGVLKKNAFVLMASTLSWVLDKKESTLREELSSLRPDVKILTAEGDYREPIDGYASFDIDDEPLKQYLDKLDTLKKGSKILVSGTMGIMERDYEKLMKSGKYSEEAATAIATGKYQKSTIAVFKKLQELRNKGVKVTIIGGDTSNYTKQYGLVGKGYKRFSGGGTPMQLCGKEIVTGLKAMNERFTQRAYEILKELSKSNAFSVAAFSEKIGIGVEEAETIFEKLLIKYKAVKEIKKITLSYSKLQANL